MDSSSPTKPGSSRHEPSAVAAELAQDGPTLIEATCPQALPPWIETPRHDEPDRRRENAIEVGISAHDRPWRAVLRLSQVPQLLDR